MADWNTEVAPFLVRLVKFMLDHRKCPEDVKPVFQTASDMLCDEYKAPPEKLTLLGEISDGLASFCSGKEHCWKFLISVYVSNAILFPGVDLIASKCPKFLEASMDPLKQAMDSTPPPAHVTDNPLPKDF